VLVALAGRALGPYGGHVERSLEHWRWSILARPGIEPEADVLVLSTAADEIQGYGVLAADGTVLVYFVSDKRDAVNPTNEIYLAAKRPGQAAFDAAVPVTDVNSATLHDHLPVVARTGSQLTLAWSRYDTQNATPWLNPKSDLYFATSTNGRNWSAPAKVTNDAGNVVHLYAAMYQAFDQQWRMLWLTNRHGATQAIALPVSGASQFPTGLVEDVLPGNGYSHRVAQTTTPGLYLGVWVQGPEGSQDIYYRLFRR